MAKVDLTINGKPTAVDAPSDMPLLWVLRDVLGLTGTKFSCGIGQCRACTVLVDGVETFSCQVAVGSVGKSEIMTIEGLASASDLHAVQRAWIEEDVVQCGYCQPGQILTATALLRRTPRPTDEDIDAAMSGNICRCGTYNRIRKAIRRAADDIGGGAK